MLRASHLASFPSPTFLRLPVSALFSLSSSSSSSSGSSFPSSAPKLSSLSFTRISTPPSSSLSKRAPSSMVCSPRQPGKVLFSSGSSGGANKEILVQHLLVGKDDHKLLMELQKRISEGADISDLAVEYSLCPSKENGGMIGWVRKGQMVTEFEEAAFNAPLNKVVRCKTKFGWHLLQVLSEREESIIVDIAPEELHSKMQDPSFIEEAQLIDVREPEEVAQASLPGFKVLPLRQFGTWGSMISDEFDPQKDTFVLVMSPWRAVATGCKMVTDTGIQEGVQRGWRNSCIFHQGRSLSPNILSNSLCDFFFKYEENYVG